MATYRFSCPRCGAPMCVGHRVVTGNDGYARRGTSRYADSKGAACSSCIDAAVRQANDPTHMKAKAVTRMANYKTRQSNGWSAPR